MSSGDLDRGKLIAERLREARKLSGLSQGQVASMLGIHRPSVSEIEAGNRKVSAEEMRKLCEIYDVNINWVLGNVAGSLSADDPRLELAARELSKLKTEDLNRLLEVIAAMRTDSSDDDGGSK